MTLEVTNIHEAKTHLSRLLEEVAQGKEIILAKAGKPMARLVPYRVEQKPRKPGGLKETLWVSPDFEEDLPPEVLKGFSGEDSWSTS